MLYVADGQVYECVDCECYGCDVTAKDKVIEIRELESITIEQKAKAKLPAGAHPVTQDELVIKLNLSEKNPCMFKSKTKAKAKED